MKNIRRYIHSAGALLISCLLLSSCVAEDLSECGSQTRLRVSFMFEEESRTRSANTETHHVTLYAFGEQGYCQLVHEFDVTGLDGETVIEAELEKGTYDFVAWVNAGKEHCSVPVFDDYPETRPLKEISTLYLNVPENDVVKYQLPRLMHGAALSYDLTTTDAVRIPLVQNTNYITFTAEGLPTTTDTYEFEVKDNNGAYNFENEFDACRPFRYIAEATFGGGKTLSAEMTTLRLGTNRTPAFIFRNATTGKTLYPSSAEQETNLVRLIQKAYEGKSVDFDKKHTFDIRLKFDVHLNAVVTVDGWNVNEGDSGLVP